MSVLHKTGYSLSEIIGGCKLGNPSWQKVLYEQYYGFGLAICLRYAASEQVALEIVNDGFVKVFRGIREFNEPVDALQLSKTFMSWFKKIMINTSINYTKSALSKESARLKTGSPEDLEAGTGENAFDGLAYMDLVRLVQQLSPAYRNTFSLYVMEGYTHDQIAKILGISVGASKSNLLKARKNLRELLDTLK
ncbi:MAG: sigma-70 family RNA polymerase sigma factor [Niabella sp.]|nr:sigma-70 family RNA polymerase sigma factor [Niabella sp.]